jgi:Na+-transporting methylmalonyl-CoA/oxaloacetate decarboxylase gamma subunit
MESQNEDKRGQGKIAGRVAVIAVHGVGDPGEGGTAQSIATLLSRVEDPQGHSGYEPFLQAGLTLGTREVDSNPPTRMAIHLSKDTPQDFLSRYLKSTPKMDVSSDPISFIRSQLKGFKPTGDDRTYETVRHSGTRLAPGSAPISVDVYEVYWADLMRIGTGFVTFFTELYQLMFHLGHLASKTVESAHAEEKENQKKRKKESNDHPMLWQSFEVSVGLAAQYLATVIFFLNVWLVPIVLLGTLLVSTIFVWQCALSGLFVAVGIALGIFAFSKERGSWLYLLTLVFAVAIAVAITFLAPDFAVLYPGNRILHGIQECFPIFFFLALFSFLIHLIVVEYDKSTPNSRTPAFLLGIVVWGRFLLYLGGMMPSVHLAIPGSFDSATLAVLETLAWLTLFMDLNYGALFVIELIAIGFGIILLMKTSKDSVYRNYIFRVFGTVIFGLGLPTVLFPLVTITAWTAYTEIVLPKFSSNPYALSWSQRFISMCNEGFTFTILGVGLAIFLVLPVLVPSILAEFCCYKRTDEHATRWLGGRLTKGGVVLFSATVILFLAGISPLVLWAIEGFDKAAHTGSSISGTVLFSSISVFGLAALVLKDHFSEWTLAVGPILNKILDVDSYLRQFPVGRTPKARVFCRYASLLRHIFKQDDVDKVVILSYSQGTVITADLLKFLNDKTVLPDPELFKLDHEGKRSFKKDVYLFTMGCPLRQLYSERFPNWYDWARSENISHSPKSPSPHIIKDDVRPLASLLGVKSWSNAYGSGDYIGRALWRGLNDPDFAAIQKETWEASEANPASSVSIKEDKTVREFCTGPFAHIQYWNEPGDSVARELDRLIK